MNWRPLETVALCGLPCSGKTTGARIIAQRLGHHHLEASRFMRRLFADRGEDGDIDTFALKELTERPTAVAEAILLEAAEQNLSEVVVSGFRSPAEVTCLGAASRMRLVFLSAPIEIRRRRSVRRQRANSMVSVSTFKRRDDLQRQMGVEEISKLAGVKLVVNAGTLSEFEQNLLSALRS